MISPTRRNRRRNVIQPGAFVGNHVKIGDDCIIHANVSIYDHSVIGDRRDHPLRSRYRCRCILFPASPEGYKKLESCGRVVIEDEVEMGAATTIDKGVSGDTIISRHKARQPHPDRARHLHRQELPDRGPLCHCRGHQDRRRCYPLGPGLREQRPRDRCKAIV